MSKKLVGTKSLNCLNFLLCIAAAYSEPSRTSTRKLFCDLFPEKCSIVDVRLGFKDASVKEKKENPKMNLKANPKSHYQMYITFQMRQSFIQ